MELPSKNSTSWPSRVAKRIARPAPIPPELQVGTRRFWLAERRAGLAFGFRLP
jgi:hypothetical protein